MLSGASSTIPPSSKPSNSEPGTGDATDRTSSGLNQHVQPMAMRPVGVSEGFGPGQQLRHPLAPQQPSGFGFSKYQLTLLRNQILAFKKLRARKV